MSLMKLKVIVTAVAAAASPIWAAEDALIRFWRENEGRSVRRLPVEVMPENVFLSFGTRDFADDMKTFRRLADGCCDRGTYNCVTLTLRCNPELYDAETMSAAKDAFARAHAEGVKVYMDTDPRIARAEFFSKWPDECQVRVNVVSAKPKDGTASFTNVFGSVQDHMSWGSKSAYRPLNVRAGAAVAVRRRTDGTLDFATAREVEVRSEPSVRSWREEARGRSGGYTDMSEATLRGTATGLAADETLVVTALADYYAADPFSPHLKDFCRALMRRYRDLGADGGMRDEWGMIPDYRPDCRNYSYSSEFAKAYQAACGRDLLADYAMMAYGPAGDATRSKAACAYVNCVLKRMAELEHDFYLADKEIFGPDAYVCKHATWFGAICRQNYFHDGLVWWQATRDFAQSDETVPIYADLGMSKKFGGPVWLNEGYTATSEQNAFRVWTYAVCGGRQVFHGLYSGDVKAMKEYDALPWAERRLRTQLDLCRPENVAAQTRVRLASLVTRAQVDCPVAFVFGYEALVDWTTRQWDDHGHDRIFALISQGWWCDAYPANEFALGTFTVDGEGYLRVGRQRYLALALHNLRAGERAALEKVIAGRTLKTKIFDSDRTAAIVAHLQREDAVRQPCFRRRTFAGPTCPEPDGTLALIDGTVVRVRADRDHLKGLPIAETLVSNGGRAAVEAEGLAAFRAEGGQTVAFAAGALRRVSAPGLELVLETPEDVALLKIDGEWHGIWQTAERTAEIPAALRRLTRKWTRLLLPSPGRTVTAAVDLADAAQRAAQPAFEQESFRVGVADVEGPQGRWCYRFKVTKPWCGELPQWPSVNLKPAVTDWSGYDRLVIDVFNDAVGGDVLCAFLSQADGRLQNGLCPQGLSLSDHGYSRWTIPLKDWPAKTDPKRIGRLHLFMTTPNSADILASGFFLLKPGEAVPPVSEKFLDEVVRPAERRAAEQRAAARRASHGRFADACRAAGQTGAHAWIGAATGMVGVRPRDGFSVRPAQAFTVRLARNEYESFQVLVTPSAGDLADVSVEVSDLVQGGTVLPASAFKTSPVGYVQTVSPAPYKSGANVATNLPGGYFRRTVKSPLGWWPDPILDHLSSAMVRTDDLQSFWVRLHCPGNQRAGTYTGTVRVKGRGWCESFPLSVRVWDFSVPRASPLPLAITFAPEPSLQYADADQLALAARLRKDPASPINRWKRHRAEWGSFLADYYITIDSLYHGGGDVNWDILEKLRAEGRLGRFNLGYWSYPENLSEESKAAWLRDVRKRFAPAYARAKERGLLGQAYLYGCDEVHSNRFPNIRWALAQLKREFPGVPLSTTAYDRRFGVGTPLAEMDWFTPTTDMYEKDIAGIPASRAAGHQVWWYIACGQQAPRANLFVEGQPIEARQLMGAQAVKYRPDGFLYYQVSIWNARRCIDGPDTFTDWDPRSWTRFHGDGSWLCAGPDGRPCATIRMENFRDGLEDYAYAREYERRTGKTAEVPPEVCRTVWQYTDDPAALYVWRDRLAEEIEKCRK